MQQGNVISLATALALVAGPALLGVAGFVRARRPAAIAAAERVARWNWKLTVISTLLYTLAFNLTFFIQEFFLVVPKAFTPGLRPTLFHNNHGWEGHDPLASLFQGTGALATFLAAVICMLFMRRETVRSTPVRLFLLWMAYCGFFMALPQVVIGALSGGSDVGMAMDYFHLGATAKIAAALFALAVIPVIALQLARTLLSLASDPVQIANARARTRFVFQAATMPALSATLLIIPFRVPRELVEVVVLPLVVAMIGVAWMQAGAWCINGVRAKGGSNAGSIAWLFCAVVVLLLVFQILLRPGIRFF